MPRIDDKMTSTKRPFKKKPYRPWNLLGEDDFATLQEKTTKKDPVSDIVIDKIPNSNQIDIDKNSISIHIDNISHPKVIEPEPVSNLISKQISNQSDHSVSRHFTPIGATENAMNTIRRVYGLQRKILFFVVEDCILRGQLISGPISIELLKQITNADTDTLKTAVQRLLKKGLMKREQGKRGQGGFAIFSIIDSIRNAVIEEQKQTNRVDTLVTNWLSKKESISTYSSSSNLNTTTNNNFLNEKIKTQHETSLWENIDISPLQSIGFTKSHLMQIALDDKLAIEVIQESIDGFAFDLEQNNKGKSLKSSPLNYFMGILRSGKPYAPPLNYESQKDKALRELLEFKKAEKEKRDHMIKELINMAFDDWQAKLSHAEKDKLIPEEVKKSPFAGAKLSSLKTYFIENIWPDVAPNEINV